MLMGNLKQIGTAKIVKEKFIEFINQEKRLAEKRESGWYVKNRKYFSAQIDDIIWGQYVKIGEGISAVIVRPSDFKVKEILKYIDYLTLNDLEWDLLLHNQIFSLLRAGELIIGLPSETVVCRKYEDLDDITLGELRGRIEKNEQFSIVHENDLTHRQMKDRISDQEKLIEAKKTEIKELEEEKKKEIERIKQEIEKKYADQMQVIEAKKQEMIEQMKTLEGQMFLMDTELYSIRCLMGETIKFIPICKGEYSPDAEPVVIYQKIRYLDEEMGKCLSIYHFDGGDLKYFEDVLREREDIRELFAPGPKSISLIQVAKNVIHYGENQFIANMLTEYKTFHGKKIGILLRDGENVWIGWTDEERIFVADGNVFYRPEKREDAIGDVSETSSPKEETAARLFIFSILQGVINNRHLLRIPEKTNILNPNPYIIFSMADGWLEDNRYGTFSDIVDRTNMPLMRKDVILTTINILRDDYRSYWTGKDTRYDAWNNGERGRGEKNRTWDASINDKTITVINCIDTIKVYKFFYKKYALDVQEVIDEQYEENGIMHTRIHPRTKRTDTYLGMITNTVTVENEVYRGINIKNFTPEEFYQAYILMYGDNNEKEYINSSSGKYDGSYYVIYDHAELVDVEKRYFVSALKKDCNAWSDKNPSYANMEIRENEYLNLTFLNSVYLLYAIGNRKIGGWKRGNKQVDYADSIEYLNKALQYIRQREEREAELLERYMDLYPDWQVDLSEWRLKNNFHRLTDSRAKKFAKEHKSIP